MPDIIVIGGGISGVASAYEAARAGASVTLLEGRRLAGMASGWTLAGVRQSGRHPAELPLAKAAIGRWAGLDQELGAPTDYRRRGNIRLARKPEEIPVIEGVVATVRAQGIAIEFLPDNAAVRAVAPALSERIPAASFCPSDGHADPIKTVAAYAAAARRHGAVIREGVFARAIRVVAGRVTGVETAEGLVPAGAVVVAAGIHAPALIAPLGLALPLSIKVVPVLRTHPLPPLLDPVFGVANGDCAGRQEADGRLRVTTGIEDIDLPEGGSPEGGWSEAAIAPTVNDLHVIIHRVAMMLPALFEARIAAMWGGLIDLTPDGLPVLDTPGGVTGLVVAAGFSGHGFALGPVVGEICAALALGRPSPHDLAAFRLARFAEATSATPLTLHG